MSLKPFGPEELAAWVDAEIADYEPQPWELTVAQYYKIEQERGANLTRRQAVTRLDRLVETGKLLKRLERVGGQEMGIYWRPGDVPAEVE